jgi:hypothetical protein
MRSRALTVPSNVPPGRDRNAISMTPRNAVAGTRERVRAVRAHEGNAVQQRAANDDVGIGLAVEAQCERGAREDRGPADATLREVGAGAERAVQEERRRLQPVELAAQVVEPGEH